MTEAEKELADAEKELLDGKKEAEEELADARKELEDGEKEYSDGKKEYEDGKEQLSRRGKGNLRRQNSLPLQRRLWQREETSLQQPSSRPQTAGAS